MCGIAGIFNYGAVAVDESAHLLRVRDAMTHRGPDGAGLYESPDHRVVLAHRRLSIVDLSECGRQPMTNEDGRLWITFNGEIYNHLEIRADLISRGHVYHSRTDTETILHLYEEMGPGCVRRLDGMFAFAIWDEAERRLTLVRDRLGKKPVYYTIAGGKLLFASEIKALLEYPGVPRELDLEALDYFLTFSNVPSPLTLFRGIRKLPPAHRLICDGAGTVRIERFWSPLEGNWSDRIDERDAVEEVRGLVKDAVRKRLMSDVPVGAFLSGGVDSSTIVALMSALTSEPLRTFSASFQGFGESENFHDIPYARRIAEMFGCQHREIEITAEDCKTTVPLLAMHQDEPIADPACLPMYFVSKAAHESGVKVVLVGEGSDEVFGGYTDFVHSIAVQQGRWRQLCSLPRPVRSAIYHGARLTGRKDGLVDVLRRAAHDEPLYWGLTIAFWETEKRRLLSPQVHLQEDGRGAADLIRRYYEEVIAAQPGADVLQQMSYVELQNRLPELLLMRVDKFAMAHSLEARAPFLDYHLTAYALSLPSRMKIAGTRTKHILKEAVAGILPADVIDRTKQGFRVPLPAWLAGELMPWAKEQLFDSSMRRLGLFDERYIQWMWDRHRDGVWDHSFDLWCLINLSAWYEHWFCE